MDRQLWTTSWGRKNTIGEALSIQSATTTRLTQIFKQYYIPNNSAVIVSGDVLPADVFNSARTHFGHWSRAADPFAGTVTPPTGPLTKSAAVIMEGDVSDIVLTMKWQGPSIGPSTDDTYTANVLSSIANTPGSAFQRHLVDTGLFTSCRMSYYTQSHVGPITLSAHTTVDSLPHALTALWAELGRLATQDGYTDAAVSDAQRARGLARALEFDQATYVARTLAFWWSAASLEYYIGYADHLRTVDGKMLAAYAARYIADQPTSVGLLAPKGTANALKSDVAQFVTALHPDQP